MFRAMGALCAFTRHTVVGGNVYPHRFFSIKMGRYWTHSHSAPGVNGRVNSFHLIFIEDLPVC